MKKAKKEESYECEKKTGSFSTIFMGEMLPIYFDDLQFNNVNN